MNNKLALLAVFLIFMLPVVTATLMHSEWFDWQPSSMRNHGELLSPVVPLADFEVPGPNSDSVTRESLLDRWTLVYYTATDCTEPCRESLYWLRQVRRAQDRHQNDVGLVFAASDQAEAATLEHLRELASDFVVLAGPQAQDFWQQLPQAGQGSAYYILDPSGNIIMMYPEDADHNGIRRDLRRLLTWTQRD